MKEDKELPSPKMYISNFNLIFGIKNCFYKNAFVSVTFCIEGALALNLALLALNSLIIRIFFNATS